jgi:Flp pilus assembly protein TadD
MSLINRMLRDLSSRERRPGDVLSGIEVPHPPPRRGPNWARLGFLLGLIALFTGGMWLLMAQRPAPGAPGAVATAPGAAASMVAGAAPAGPGERLRLDETLSTVPEPRARAARRAPAVSEAEATAPAGTPAPESAPPPAAKPAPASRPRDARAAAQKYAEARRALERGDDVSAADGFAAALELDPALRGAREDLGTLRLRQGRLQEAEAILRTGLEQEPSWIGYRRLAARLELARNNGAAAVALLERDRPDVAADPEYHGLLASAYQRVGRHDDAALSYQALSQQQPGVAQWWAGYGLSRDALGDVPGALAAYSQARTLGGLDARVLQHINRRSAALTAGG